MTIVIPTLGRGRVVVNTLSYLYSLDAKAEEIIVVDQTSFHDPETEAYLKSEHGRGRIRWIRHQPPGVAGAMNRGLAEATGDIVLFLDDDIIPSEGLVAAHQQAYVEHPEAWAVVGQVIQPEDCRPQTADRRPQADEGEPQNTQKDTEKRRETEDRCNSSHANHLGFKNPLLCILRYLWFPFSSESFLRRDLDFRFNGTEPAWVENVMAGNLSVKRDKALVLGGFDEKFIPPVSYRFETEFAKRIISAGGRIRFEPTASVRHLRAPQGGTRSCGNHLTSVSPLHGVGDYYYAMQCGRGWERVWYMAKRPFREVSTKFHLRHPWWIPLKFIGELCAVWMAFRLNSEWWSSRSRVGKKI